MKMTGLHLAAYFGLESLVLQLLDRHEPDTTNIHGRTPLSLAAENGHEGVARLLLAKGAEIDLKIRMAEGRLDSRARSQSCSQATFGDRGRCRVRGYSR